MYICTNLVTDGTTEIAETLQSFRAFSVRRFQSEEGFVFPAHFPHSPESPVIQQLTPTTARTPTVV